MHALRKNGMRLDVHDAKHWTATHSVFCRDAALRHWANGVNGAAGEQHFHRFLHVRLLLCHWISFSRDAADDFATMPLDAHFDRCACMHQNAASISIFRRLSSASE
jgi:hypothetical protein